MKITELESDLLAALGERGFSDAEIEAMAPARMIEEYFAWHLGDRAWGRDAVRLCRNVFKIPA